MMGAHRDPWLVVLFVVVCLVVVASDQDHTSIPVADPFWWPFLYGGAAVALIGWRLSNWRPLLVAFGAILCTASLARSIAFLVIDNPNYAAAGIHGLLATFTFSYVQSRSHEEEA